MCQPAVQGQKTDRRAQAQAEHPRALEEFRGKYNHMFRKGLMNDVAECSDFHPLLEEIGMPQNQNQSSVDENVKSRRSYVVLCRCVRNGSNGIQLIQTDAYRCANP